MKANGLVKGRRSEKNRTITWQTHHSETEQLGFIPKIQSNVKTKTVDDDAKKKKNFCDLRTTQLRKEMAT